MSDIKYNLKYECSVTIKEDVTAYGNRFSIQVEDTDDDNNYELKTYVGKRFKAIIILEEQEDG